MSNEFYINVQREPEIKAGSESGDAQRHVVGRATSPELDHAVDTKEQYQMYDIEDADISKKVGNYVLTFGRVGSSKSTLQQHIITWLYDKSQHVVELNAVDGYFEPVIFLQDLVDKQRRGELPKRTTKSKQTEFSVTVTPKNTKLSPLTFGFFEISGEDLKTVVPILGKGFRPSLPPAIHKFLSNNNISFSFLFVSDASLYVPSTDQNKSKVSSDKEQQPREDILFCDFLNYLSSNFGRRFATVPILFVIAKWDEVEHIYADGGSYMERNLNGTYNRLKEIKSRKVTVDLVRHSIGKIEAIDGEPMIKRSNFDSTQKVTEWVYKSFVGKDINGVQNTNTILSGILRWL